MSKQHKIPKQQRYAIKKKPTHTHKTPTKYQKHHMQHQIQQNTQYNKKQSKEHNTRQNKTKQNITKSH